MLEEAIDNTLYLLADRRRRRVLFFLNNYVEFADAEQLVEYLVDCERGPGVDEDALRKEIAIALHHIHLPKLLKHGTIGEDFIRSQGDNTPVYRYRLG